MPHARSIFIGQVDTTCNTSTGNQTFTDSSLGSRVPKAALFMINGATSAATSTNHFLLGFGATDGTTQWAQAGRSEHGLATSDTSHIHMNDKCIAMLLSGGGIDGEAEFVSFSAGSVTINWTNALASAYRITVILFAGSSLEVDVGNVSVGSTSSTTVTTGFETDVVIAGWFNVNGSANSANDTETGGMSCSVGFAINDGSDTNRGIVVTSADNSADSRTYQVSFNNGCVAKTRGLAGSFNSNDRASVTTYTSTGFDVDSGGTFPAGYRFLYLALHLGGANASIDSLSIPGSAGNESITAPGFKPQFVMNLGTENIAFFENSSQQGNSFGAGFATANTQGSFSATDEYNQGTMDTESRYETAMTYTQGDQGGGGGQAKATFVSFDSNGWTWNWSSISSTRRLYSLAIEEGTPRRVFVV